MNKRVILIILDSVGVGAQPDAKAYGDEGANTLLNIYRHMKPELPHMERLGLLEVVRSTADQEALAELPKTKTPIEGAYGRALAKAAGKDTTTGHWEIAGDILERPFPTYPEGFPPEIIDAFEKATGRGVLANVPASGTEIIERLGKEHMETGKLIVYTSADSVFQIAAHEDIVPIEDLYRYSQAARDILTGEHAVGRVIARPFVGTPGSFERTPRRRDFSLEPTAETMLDKIKAASLTVMSVGKIKDIFAGKGITDALESKNNDMGVTKTLEAMQNVDSGLIFTNLVDFDMKYGHRNDTTGYANALKAFDERLPEVIAEMTDADLLILTADHGVDPFYPGTDHTRESVPVLAYMKNMKEAISLGVRETFADVGQTICDWLEVESLEIGTSFLSLLHR